MIYHDWIIIMIIVITNWLSHNYPIIITIYHIIVSWLFPVAALQVPASWRMCSAAWSNAITDDDLLWLQYFAVWTHPKLQKRGMWKLKKFSFLPQIIEIINWWWMMVNDRCQARGRCWLWPALRFCSWGHGHSNSWTFPGRGHLSCWSLYPIGRV